VDLYWVAIALPAALAGGILGGLLVAQNRPGTPTGTARPSTPSARALLEALPLAVLAVDENEQVLLGNRSARELGLVTDGALTALPQLLALVRDTRVHARPFEADLTDPVRRSGRAPAYYRVRLAPLGEGTVALTLEDVTDARRLEDVRRDFVVNVSHELKTPAAALGLLSEALVDAAEDPDAVRRFAQSSQREAARLGNLVQDLVALSRLEGAEAQPQHELVRLDRAVADAADRVRTTAQARGIEVLLSGSRDLHVLGTQSQLTTAIGNLLENAVNYSPDGARVVLGTRRDGEFVEINVVDEGIGIASEDLDRVFERFYRSDPARSRATGGTGLGLAIVKHVVANHGGTVNVRSNEGFGSTFTLRLPAADTSPADTDADTHEGAP
jgi:two-component system sensor histidine kinase SenX3